MSEETTATSQVAELQYPAKYDTIDENICIDHMNNSQYVFVGNEKGCFLSDITTHKYQTINFSDPVTSICHDETHDIETSQVYYFASNKSIYRIDIRESLDPKLLFSDQNEDEINQLKLKSLHLAACDDAGECKIFDVQNINLYRTLRRQHTNICSTIIYHPSKPDIIMSGGLDSQLVVWDYRRVKVVSSFDVQTILKNLGDDSVFMFNPPHVHSIDITENYLVCALGNGSIQLFKNVAHSKQILYPSKLINFHSSVGVSTVSFAKFNERESEDLLISGGNDGVVSMWSLPKDLRKKTTNSVADQNEMENLLVRSEKFTLKVNAVTSGIINNNKFIFVADQSPTVKVMKFQ